MLLEIVKYGHPALRTKGAPVKQIDDKIRKLAEDMFETMVEANGVGLAAQQVGVPIMMAIVDVSGVEDRPSTMTIGGQAVDPEEYMPMVLINPVLELSKDKEPGTEGCLSFPDMTGEIPRSKTVKTRATLIDGEEIEFESTGLLARAIQHEFDHLMGVLFIDRMDAATKTSLSGKLKRLQKANER